MQTKAIWEKRVRDWQASGVSSTQFCEGRPFVASTLRYYASRLGVERGRKRRKHAVRLARVVRVAAAPQVEALAPALLRDDNVPAAIATCSDSGVSVELGAMRVTVTRGFDAGTLARLLDVVAAQARQR